MDKKTYWAGWKAEKVKNHQCVSCGTAEASQHPDGTWQLRCGDCKEHRKAMACNTYETSRTRQKTLRLQAMDKLGHVCACCGLTELMFLTFDHINNDGNKERKDSEVARMYRGILAGTRPDIQVLCWNCNLGKKLNGGTCPHKDSLQLCNNVRI